MRTAAAAVLVLAFSACATSHQDAAPMRVRVMTMPDAAYVKLDCGKTRFEGAAPIDFDFPDGPYAHCVADITSEKSVPLRVDIDRQFLFEHGEVRSHSGAQAPAKVEPSGTGNAWELIAVSIERGIDDLVAAAHNAAVADEPDVTLKIALLPAGPPS